MPSSRCVPGRHSKREQVSRSGASFIAAQVMTETGLSIFAERIPIEQLTVDKKRASTFNDRFPLLSGDRDVDRAFSVKDLDAPVPRRARTL
jgi:hypothetical protein